MTRAQVKLLVPKSQIKIATFGVITLFPAPAGRRRQKTRRVVRFVTTVLRPINPVASVTLRDLVESVGDCFTLAYEK